tara:strand:- start:29 stop:343 length:315 start_codon:yes stop_codon:yes gene_type:complete
MKKSTEIPENATPDQIICALINRIDTAAATIDEVEDELHDLKDKLKKAPLLSDAGIDDVFLMSELPGILRVLRELPDAVRNDPCRRHELDQLDRMLRKVDAVVR